MSKKGNKNQPQKKHSDIVDQQKDPMLRAIQKKVRNINKKLTQIAQLSLKKDLKPEQEQKINKREQLVQEREKYQEMVTVYQQIAAENEKLVKRAQMIELEDLAAIIAVKQYGVDLGFLYNQNVDNLVRILTTPTASELTLQQRIKQIITAFSDVSNNPKLKKNVKEFIDSNADYRKQKVNAQCFSHQPEPISPRSEQERKAELKELQQQEKKGQNQDNQPLTPQLQAPANLQRDLQVNEIQKVKSQEKSSKDQVITQDKEGQLEKVDQKDEGEKKNENQPVKTDQNGNKDPRGGRGKDGQKYNDGEKFYKKRSFKPKYDEKPIQKNDDNQSSSNSSQPKARQFKRQEVRELIQDGFIVVGKPKAKARPKDQKQYHDHQHGNKYHKHHSKKNF